MSLIKFWYIHAAFRADAPRRPKRARTPRRPTAPSATADRMVLWGVWRGLGMPLTLLPPVEPAPTSEGSLREGEGGSTQKLG